MNISSFFDCVLQYYKFCKLFYMGAAQSCIIYDPNDKGYDMQPLSKKYGIRITEWKLDEKDRMVCRESVDLFYAGFDPDLKQFFRDLHELGLKRIYKTPDFATSPSKEYIINFTDDIRKLK